MNNVIAMSATRKGIAEAVVIEPRQFAEMPQAIQALRERKTVLLDLTMMEPKQAQRSLDFVLGAVYSIEGEQERLNESIFLFTPNCAQLSKY